MSQLRYWRLGRTILWRGAPIRAAVGVEALPRTSPAHTGRSHPEVRLALHPEGQTDIVVLPVRVRGGFCVFEVGTQELPAGPIGVEVVIGEPSKSLEHNGYEEVELPDEIWLLERERYDDLLRLEADEEFMSSPELDSEGVWSLTKDVCRGALEPLALDRDWALEDEEQTTPSLHGDEHLGHGSGQSARQWSAQLRRLWKRRRRSSLTVPVMPDAHSLSPPYQLLGSDRPSVDLRVAVDRRALEGWAWPGNPLRWTLEQFAGIVHELAVPGVESLHLVLRGTPTEIEIWVTGTALDPLSQGLVESLCHDQLGEIPTLNRNAPWLNLAADLSPGETAISAQMRLNRAIPLRGGARAVGGASGGRGKRPRFAAALDQGTNSSRAMIFNHEGRVVAVSQKDHEQIYPKPGWVEQDPKEIVARCNEVLDEAMEKAGASAEDIAALGITNQRETTVVWDRNTGEPIHNALVWQDTRTDKLVDELSVDGGQDRFREKVGLPLATYFSGPKARWLLDNVEGAREKAEAGDLMFGNIDTWCIWNLTGGTNGGLHITDVSNASRTMLMDLHTLSWDKDIASAIGVPTSMLPEIRPSSQVYGEVKSGKFAGVLIAGDLGDEQAAAFGQACFSVGDAKNTYGTGNLMLLNTGTEAVQSTSGR